MNFDDIKSNLRLEYKIAKADWRYMKKLKRPIRLRLMLLPCIIRKTYTWSRLMTLPGPEGAW